MGKQIRAGKFTLIRVQARGGYVISIEVRNTIATTIAMGILVDRTNLQNFAELCRVSFNLCRYQITSVIEQRETAKVH